MSTAYLIIFIKMDIVIIKKMNEMSLFLNDFDIDCPNDDLDFF